MVWDVVWRVRNLRKRNRVSRDKKRFFAINVYVVTRVRKCFVFVLTVRVMVFRFVMRFDFAFAMGIYLD